MVNELYYRVDEELKVGLRKDARAPRNTGALSVCTNLKPAPYGLVDMEVMGEAVDLSGSGLSVTWPFPQLFVGSQVALLADSTAVRPIDMSTDPWTIGAAYATVSTASPYGAKAITAGGPWQFVDLGPSWYLFNGSCVVFKCNLNAVISTYPDSVFVYDTNTILTGCYHKGRVLMAGFDSTDTDVIWTTLYANSLCYSGIGGSDTLWHFFSALMTDELLAFAREKNDWGNVPASYPGNIRCLKVLGDRVVLYGDDGVDIGHSFADPVPGIGLQHLHDVGIASRGAVGGTRDIHVFVDSTGYLWSVTPQEGAKKLGYKEYFTSMLGNDILIVYNPVYREFHISDGSTAYVLTESGLAKGTQMLTCVVNDSGTPKGLYPAYSDNDDFTLTIGEFDKGLRGWKTIRNIHMYGYNLSSVQARVGWRGDDSDALQYTEWTSANNLGVAHFPIGLVSGTMQVRGTSGGTDGRLEAVEARYTEDDKRHIRGVFERK